MPIVRTHSLTERTGRQAPQDPALRFDHLDRMLTHIGIWQHAEGDRPNPRHGYSIDDQARGLIVALRHWERGVETAFNHRLGRICFHFLENAAITRGQARGRYHNFCDADGHWLDAIGSDDSFGRTLWSLGVAHAVDAPFAPREAAEVLLRRSLPVIESLIHPRARAFALLGLAASRLDDARLRLLADSLAGAYEATARDDWRWFEDSMTYSNARLPQAMFAAAQVFPEEERYARIGAESLDFLLRVTRWGKNGYAPVGNAPMEMGGWFRRGDARPPLFDQQPVDAGALAECCVTAYQVTGEPRFRNAAHQAFGWYHGDNIHGAPVYNPATGGVADAITRGGLNRNQGAESVLSIHLAHHALEMLE